MITVKLGSVCEVLSGFAFKSSEFGQDGMPIVRIRDVTRGFTETFYSGSYEEQYLIDNGDILIGMDGDFNLSEWKGGKALLNQRVCKLIVDENVWSKKFLFYFLPQKLLEIWHDTPFVTVKHLSVKKIVDIDVPNFPLEQQKKIAAILEKADQLRKDCKQMEDEFNNLSKSVFMGMFGETSQDYLNWPKFSIETLAKPEVGSMRTGPFGSDLKHSEFIDDSSGVAVIGIDNAVKNEFSWGERRFISLEKYERLKRYTVFPEDLIVTIMGTNGRIAVIPDNIPLAISTKHLAVITLNQELALPRFVHSAFKLHPAIQFQLLQKCKGAVMDGLNLGLIKGLELKLPPLDLQKKYVEIIDRIENQIAVTRQLCKQYEDCFNSLLTKSVIVADL